MRNLDQTWYLKNQLLSHEFEWKLLNMVWMEKNGWNICIIILNTFVKSGLPEVAMHFPCKGGKSGRTVLMEIVPYLIESNLQHNLLSSRHGIILKQIPYDKPLKCLWFSRCPHLVCISSSQTTGGSIVFFTKFSLTNPCSYKTWSWVITPHLCPLG